MGRYRKGARAERELCKMLEEMGYAIVRSAGSGLMQSPDIVAVKNGKVFAFECKFWKNGGNLKKEEVKLLDQWCNRASAYGYVAWKVAYEGWRFIPLNEMLAKNRNLQNSNFEEFHELDHPE